MTSFDEVVSPVDQRSMSLRANAAGVLYVTAREEHLRGGVFARRRLHAAIAQASTLLSREDVQTTIDMAREED